MCDKGESSKYKVAVYDVFSSDAFKVTGTKGKNKTTKQKAKIIGARAGIVFGNLFTLGLVNIYWRLQQDKSHPTEKILKGKLQKQGIRRDIQMLADFANKLDLDGIPCLTFEQWLFVVSGLKEPSEELTETESKMVEKIYAHPILNKKVRAFFEKYGIN